MRTILFLVVCFPLLLQAQVRTGADVLVQSHLELLHGKRVGLVTNQTGRVQNGEYLVDVLLRHGITVVSLFGPEHGIRGESAPGESVADSIDPRTGIRVYSLYGKTNKPTPAMLANIDILLYDIQDVGVRYYTYISTMYYVMEAAAEQGIPVLVLDRPDPLGGVTVDGPVLVDSLRSFVGMMPIPIVYGLTCGELARMINGEGWLPGRMKAELTVLPMTGWRRTMHWRDTGVPWVAPSPNIPDPETCFAYPVTCFLEATNISEGRGTSHPFLTIGAPFIDGDALAAALKKGCPTIRWEPVSFTPSASKHAGVRCNGVRLTIPDSAAYAPVHDALSLLVTLTALYPDQCVVRVKGLERLAGTPSVQACLDHRTSIREVISSWETASSAFRKASLPYLLYP
jgi:uncharacterized protein YbbC (DUF1343 family)